MVQSYPSYSHLVYQPQNSSWLLSLVQPSSPWSLLLSYWGAWWSPQQTIITTWTGGDNDWWLWLYAKLWVPGLQLESGNGVVKCGFKYRLQHFLTTDTTWCLMSLNLKITEKMKIMGSVCVCVCVCVRWLWELNELNVLITATVPAGRYSVNVTSILLLFIVNVDSHCQFRCCSGLSWMALLIRAGRSWYPRSHPACIHLRLRSLLTINHC